MQGTLMADHMEEISRASRLRRVLGIVTSALLFTAMACLVDALREGFLDGGREFQAIPGETVSLTSLLPPGATTLETMKISGGDSSVALKPEALYTGFWLGQTMWKGFIEVANTAAPGERVFVLEGPLLDKPKTGPANVVLRVTVHADAMAKRMASPSFITRTFGIPPYVAALWVAGAALALGAAGYAASRQVELLLSRDGKGVVYMVKKTDDGSVIGFSLGTEQGLAPGMTVRVFNREGQGVGEAKVTASLQSDATAVVVSGSCALGDTVMLSRARADAAGQGA